MVWAVHSIITISTEDSSTRARDERVHVTSASGVPQLLLRAAAILTFFALGVPQLLLRAAAIPAASGRGQRMPGDGVHGQAHYCHGASLTRRVRELATSFVLVFADAWLQHGL